MARCISVEEFISRLNKSKYADTNVADDMLNILFKCDSDEDYTGICDNIMDGYTDKSSVRKNRLSKTDEKILLAIRNYHDIHGYMPSYREISNETGLSSTSTIKAHMERLLDMGELETDISDTKQLPARAYRMRGRY